MHESFYAKITLKPGKGKNKKNVSGNQKKIDHLELVTGIMDKIGIVDKINELIEEKNTEKVSADKVIQP